MTAQASIWGPVRVARGVGARLAAGALLWAAGWAARALHDWDAPDHPGDVG